MRFSLAQVRFDKKVFEVVGDGEEKKGLEKRKLPKSGLIQDPRFLFLVF